MLYVLSADKCCLSKIRNQLCPGDPAFPSPGFEDKTGVPVPIPDVLSMDETQLVDRMMDFVALGT